MGSHTLVALALLVSLGLGCQRPGTDRPLNCERYADALVTRSFECGAKKLDGVALTTDNVASAAKQIAATCEKDETITATADCVKAIKKAACADSALVPADIAICRKP